MSRISNTIRGFPVLLLAFAALASCGGRSATLSQQTGSAPAGIRYEGHLSAGGKSPAGNVLRNPKSGDAATARTGASLFTAMNCDGCHGGGGSGWVGPSLADGRWRYGGSDAEIFT